MCIEYSYGQTFACVLDITMVKRLYVYIEYSYSQTFVCVLNIAMVKRLYVYWI